LTNNAEKYLKEKYEAVSDRNWDYRRTASHIKIERSHLPNEFHVIDLEKNTCSCGIQHVTRRPCYHMVWRCVNVEPLLNVYDLFPEEDKTNVWKRQYQNITFNPIETHDLREGDSNNTWKEPVAIRNPKGRPKKHKRKRKFGVI
jgi:hypothetical protein